MKKGQIPFTDIPPVLLKETSLSKAKIPLTATASIVQLGKQNHKKISSFKKWTDAKSQNVDLFCHGYSQTLKVNELTVKTHSDQCICIPHRMFDTLCGTEKLENLAYVLC